MYKLISLLKRFLSPYYKEILKSIISRFLFRRRKKFLKKLHGCPSNYEPKEDIKLIIFLVIDCLRKDHLSLYGYKRNTTPFLKRIGNNAAVFTNTISSSNWTYPSVLSIMSGLYPHHHGGFFKEKIRNFSKDMLPMKPHSRVLQIQDILALLGFDTFFLSSVATSGFSIEGTFSHYKIIKKDAVFFIDEMKKFIKGSNRKKIFYIQLGDLHHPINPPLNFRNRFGKVKNLPNIEGWDYLNNPEDSDEKFNEFRENKIKLYDATIYFLDATIKKFFNFLEKVHLLEKSLIVITADHGEEFWEHKDIEKKYFFDPRGFYGCGHGHNFFQEVISVPLILFGPGVPKERFRYRVSLVDIVPTCLDFLGIKRFSKLDGLSLFDSQNNRFILSEENAYGYARSAIFYKQFKMIYSPNDNIKWFFDLSKDPYERNSLIETGSSEFDKMLNYVCGIKRCDGDENIKIDKETKEQLSYLGYF